MAVVEVNPEGLTAAGTQLAGTSQTYTPAFAVPPGADMTSVSAAEHLNALSQGLVARLNHGSALRELGGQAVVNTAGTLVRQDDANAATIADGNNTGGPVGGLMSVPHVAAPVVPDVPQIPAALAPLPGEAHSQALYGGPGSSSVYQFAAQWSRHGDQLSELADAVTRTGQSINEHWDHGQQQAGANTLRHASWVAEMSQQAHGLAGYGRTIAESFDTAKANTPSPQEFAQTRTQLQAAVQRFAATKGANAAEVQQLTHQYANQQAEATQAVTGYHGQVSTASFTTGSGIKDAPSITGGGLQAVDFKQDPPPPAPPLPPPRPQTGEPIKLPSQTTPRPVTVINLGPLDDPQKHYCGPAEIGKDTTIAVGGALGIATGVAGEIPTLGAATAAIVAGAGALWDGMDKLGECK